MPAGLTILSWSAAAAISLAGAAILARSLRGDPARGRRRCPKCWYAMPGVPGLTCPECGHAARDESRLFRNRRPRRWLALSLLLLALGAGLWYGERVHRLKWRAAPTTVRILAIPWVDLAQADFQQPLSDGVSRGLYSWHRALLVRRLSAAMESDSTSTREVACSLTEQYRREVDMLPLLPNLQRLLDDANDRVASSAAYTISAIHPRDPHLADSWIRLLKESPHETVHVAAAAALRLVGAGPERDAALLHAITHGSPRAAAQAAVTVGHLRIPGGVEALLPLLDPERYEYFGVAANSLARFGDEASAALPRIASWVHSSDPKTRYFAIRALGLFGPVARPAIPDLIWKIQSADEQTLMQILDSLGRIAARGDPQAFRACLPFLRSGPRAVRIQSLKALARLEWSPPESDRAFVESCLADTDGEARIWARVALAVADNRTEPLIDELIALLDSEEVWEATEAAHALGWIGAPARRAIPALQRYAKPLTPDSSGDDDQKWQSSTRAIELINAATPAESAPAP